MTYRIDDTPMTVKLRPDPAEQVEAQTPPVVRLDLPATLEANSARSGWFLFRVHDELTAPGPIDRYELVVHDVHGTERELQVTVLKQS